MTNLFLVNDELRRFMRRYWYIVIISLLGFSCASQDLDNPISDIPVPYLKNSPGECYYLDEFMPIPEALVAGKKGRLYLRSSSYDNNFARMKQSSLCPVFQSLRRCFLLQYFAQPHRGPFHDERLFLSQIPAMPNSWCAIILSVLLLSMVLQ